MNTIIESFFGGYRFLSNFYPARVVYRGLTFSSSEAAYQAEKCIEEHDRLAFTQYEASEAKRQGQQIAVRSDWEQIKYHVMLDIVTEKFRQNPDLAERLLATGDAPLYEGNDWGDTYWGIDIDTKEGQNHLGKILMHVRSELRQENI